jgi:N-acetylmuramoyl-L-alanine amidase
MTYRKLHSPNFNERREGQKPSMVILHYTGTPTPQEAEDIYMMPDKVSPHYMVYGDGSVTQFVAEDKRAWHAGLGSWGRVDDINSASIGIEIWNTGHEYLHEDFLAEQITSVIDLVRGIKERHDIPDYHILGHSDVAPGRKIDPGEKFPWRKLAEAGIGLIPEINQEDELLAMHWMDQPNLIMSGLKEYGYDPQVEADIVLREFRRHFLPDTLNDWGADTAVCAALAALVRQKRKLKFVREHRAAV